MKRRFFFSGFLKAAAAVAVASSMEVFGAVEQPMIVGLDPSFSLSESLVVICQKNKEGEWVAVDEPIKIKDQLPDWITLVIKQP